MFTWAHGTIALGLVKGTSRAVRWFLASQSAIAGEAQLPATIKDIAAKLGVSHTTVSRALRGHPHVDETLRRKIKDAARQLNYRPNALAQGLKDMRTRVVGLIITDLMNDFSAEAATIIQSELAKEGYRLLLCVSGDDPSSELAYLKAMREERVEGLILVPTVGGNTGAVEEYTRDGVPVVEFIRTTNSHLDSVVMDDFGGALAMTEHLLAMGHTRIGVVLGQAELSTAQGRLQGYLRAHANGGIPVDYALVKAGRLTRSSGRTAVDELMRLPSPPQLSSQRVAFCCWAPFTPYRIRVSGYQRTFHWRDSEIPSGAPPGDRPFPPSVCPSEKWRGRR
jgi:DNA-binding LacI/PurR family transcriptional regulator